MKSPSWSRLLAGHEDDLVHHPDDGPVGRRGDAYLPHLPALGLDDVLVDVEHVELGGDDVGDAAGQNLGRGERVRTGTRMRAWTTAYRPTARHAMTSIVARFNIPCHNRGSNF